MSGIMGGGAGEGQCRACWVKVEVPSQRGNSSWEWELAGSPNHDSTFLIWRGTWMRPMTMSPPVRDSWEHKLCGPKQPGVSSWEMSPEKHSWKIKPSPVFLLQVPLPRTSHWHPSASRPSLNSSASWQSSATGLKSSQWPTSQWTSENIISPTLTLPQCSQWRKLIPRGELTGYSQSRPFPQLGFLICAVLKTPFLSKKTVVPWGQGKCHGLAEILQIEVLVGGSAGW